MSGVGRIYLASATGWLWPHSAVGAPPSVGGLQQTVLLSSGLTDDSLLTYIGKDVLRLLCYFLIGVGDIPQQKRALRDDHTPQFLKSCCLIWSVEVNAAPDKLKEFSRQLFTSLRQDVENKRERMNCYWRRADTTRDQIAPEFAACSECSGQVGTCEAFQYFSHLVRRAEAGPEIAPRNRIQSRPKRGLCELGHGGSISTPL